MCRLMKLDLRARLPRREKSSFQVLMEMQKPLRQIAASADLTVFPEDPARILRQGVPPLEQAALADELLQWITMKSRSAASVTRQYPNSKSHASVEVHD